MELATNHKAHNCPNWRRNIKRNELLLAQISAAENSHGAGWTWMSVLSFRSKKLYRSMPLWSAGTGPVPGNVLHQFRLQERHLRYHFCKPLLLYCVFGKLLTILMVRGRYIRRWRCRLRSQDLVLTSNGFTEHSVSSLLEDTPTSGVALKLLLQEFAILKATRSHHQSAHCIPSLFNDFWMS